MADKLLKINGTSVAVGNAVLFGKEISESVGECCACYADSNSAVKRGDYIPAERAAKAYKTVSRILSELGM